MKTREKTFDIAKGIGILLVVLGHMPTLLPESILVWIKGFHMPLFFFISGYFATPVKNVSNILTKLKKKVSTILLPYLIYSIFFAVLDFWALDMNVEIFNERIHLMLTGSGGYYMLWFLFSLFLVEFLFYIITYICKTEKLRLFLFTSCVLIGFLLKHVFHYNNYKIGTSLYILGVFCIGYLCKTKGTLLSVSSAAWTFIGICINLLGTYILYKTKGFTLELVDNQTVDIFLNYTTALSAIIVVLNISRWLSKYKASCILEYIGRNSLYFYPLTGYIPDLVKLVLGDSKIIKIISRIFAFIFTCGFIEIKKLITNHTAKY